jgi:hypothetical protein
MQGWGRLWTPTRSREPAMVMLTLITTAYLTLMLTRASVSETAWVRPQSLAIVRQYATTEGGGQAELVSILTTVTDPTTNVVTLSRPLCLHPEMDYYKGHGNTNEASGFHSR